MGNGRGTQMFFTSGAADWNWAGNILIHKKDSYLTHSAIGAAKTGSAPNDNMFNVTGKY